MSHDVLSPEAAPEQSQAVELIGRWIKTVGPFWAASVAGHLIALIVLALVLGTVHVAKKIMLAPEFAAEIETALPDPDLSHFEIGETPLEPTVLDTESLTLEPPQIEQTEKHYDNSALFEEAGGGSEIKAGLNLGGLGGFEFKAVGEGAAVTGKGGVGASAGLGGGGGSGGAGEGFGGRGTGSRKAMVGGWGGTKQSERAVAGALNWIYRHQNPDGGWSLNYTKNCKDSTCVHPGNHASDTAATALALLPFLAAGQTHDAKGPYQKTISNGINWLVKDLSKGAAAKRRGRNMYAHGLAAITMCEAYGLSRDKKLEEPAQAAIKYIEEAQNQEDGGWRYTPGQVPGDTSVVGWQIMALKSAQMAGLIVDYKTMEGAKKYLKLASTGKSHGLYNYIPGQGSGKISMTAVGMLCSQYMGTERGDPAMAEGMRSLMWNQPNLARPDIYYWYYATQAMHNLPGPEWDQWNRQMRRTLIETQAKEACVAGSWDPEKLSRGHAGDAGGRLFVTSLACLTLEVYYRYLPLYKLDKTDDVAAR